MVKMSSKSGLKSYFVSSLLILIMIGCKKNHGLNENTNMVDETSVIRNEQLTEVDHFNTFPDLPIRTIPFIDSTNFNNYVDEDGIKNDLFIQKIGFEKHNPETENIRLRYRIHYSDTFYSAIISYRSGEHELFTSLLNIDKDKKIIDQLNIAYDEIAESAFRKTSTFNPNKIVVEDWNYMSEPPIKKTEAYTISKEGMFKLISD